MQHETANRRHPEHEALEGIVLRLSSEGRTPQADDADLHDLATAIFILVSEGSEEGIVEAVRCLEIGSNARGGPSRDADAVSGAMDFCVHLLRTARQDRVERRIGRLLVDEDLVDLARLLAGDGATEAFLASDLGVGRADLRAGLALLDGAGVLHRIRGLQETTWVLTRPGGRALVHAEAADTDASRPATRTIR